MLLLQTNILYLWIILFGIYGILVVPFFGSKILMKTGESERFWFFILVILNFWGLLFILLRPSFRKRLNRTDKINLSMFAVGYWVIFLPLILIN